MEWISVIQQFFDDLQEREFQKYLMIVGGILVGLCSLLVFFHYRTVRTLRSQIHQVNEERERIQEILERAQRVQQQERRINTMLASSEDFKIRQYFERVLEQVRLNHKQVGSDTITPVERQDKYREINLSATLSNMNMKEVASLLQELEKTERIYTKELVIKKNGKSLGLLSIDITIGTVLARASDEIEGLE